VDSDFNKRDLELRLIKCNITILNTMSSIEDKGGIIILILKILNF
jgi:hypothetical protein